MGAVLIEVCGRCGTPNGEGRQWVNNAFKTLHRCSDGIMGELAQVDPTDPDNIPYLDPKYLEPDNHLRIVKRGKNGGHYYAMIVQCHKCRVEVHGDYGKDEADKLRYNLFNCSNCGEWQEWMMHLVDGDPLPLKQWKPFDWSKVPTSREESRRLIRSMADALRKTPDPLQIGLDNLDKLVQAVNQPTVALPAGTTVVQSTGYPATFGPAGAGSNGNPVPPLPAPSKVVPTPPPQLKSFSVDAIENARFDRSCRVPYCKCASCYRDMTVKVWVERQHPFGSVRKLPTFKLVDGTEIKVEVLYHCDVCERDDLYTYSPTPPADAGGRRNRHPMPVIRGAWYVYTGTFFKDKNWNPPINWRAPDAILPTTPIKAQGSDQTPVF